MPHRQHQMYYSLTPYYSSIHENRHAPCTDSTSSCIKLLQCMVREPTLATCVPGMSRDCTWHVDLVGAVALLRTGVMSKMKFWRVVISQTIPLSVISH